MTSAMTLAPTRAGEPINVRNLTIFPLFSEEVPTHSYLTLDEALGSGVAETTEVSEAGSVPELRFVNSSELPVLLLDGEELMGAKQNRVLNLSILAPPNAETLIPVSCIEAGRWQFKSRAFQTSDRAQHARGRAMKMMSVSASLKRGHSSSDQAQVWEEIERKRRMMKATSATSALSDVFEAHKPAVDHYAEQVRLPETAVGAVFAINGRVLGLEVFDKPDTCARLIGKLIRSWSLDALEREQGKAAGGTDLRVDVEALLKRVQTAKAERVSAEGMGDHVRFEDEEVVGGALVLEDHLIHGVAFVRELAANNAPEDELV